MDKDTKSLLIGSAGVACVAIGAFTTTYFGIRAFRAEACDAAFRKSAKESFEKNTKLLNDGKEI